MSKQLPTSHPLVRAVLRSLTVILPEKDERVIAELVGATLPKHYLQSPASVDDGSTFDPRGTLADVGAVVGSAYGQSDCGPATGQNFVPAQTCVNAIGIHGESSGGVTDSGKVPLYDMYAHAQKNVDLANEQIVRLKRDVEHLRTILKEQEKVANTLREHRDQLMERNTVIGERNDVLRKAMRHACDTIRAADDILNATTPTPR